MSSIPDAARGGWLQRQRAAFLWHDFGGDTVDDVGERHGGGVVCTPRAGRSSGLLRTEGCERCARRSGNETQRRQDDVEEQDEAFR